MELSKPVTAAADLAERINEREAMPVTVLFRAEDTDYERGGDLYWARSDIGAVAEHGGILYLIAPDPQMVSTDEDARLVTNAFETRRHRERSAVEVRVAELEAQLESARAELDKYRKTADYR